MIDWEARLRSLLGLVMLIGLAWLWCRRDLRRRIPWKAVGWGLVLQFVLAILILKLQWAGMFFRGCNDLVVGLLTNAQEGAKLPFGVLVDSAKLSQVFGAENGTIFAFSSLVPTIVFFSALTSIGYQIGLMQWVVGLVARVVLRIMGTSGAETVSAVGNIFLGMVEAPLAIRPYLARLTRSELLCVMVCGLSNVAGSVLAVYAGLLSAVLPSAAGHLIMMSVMSMPAGLVISKLMLPETGVPETLGRVAVDPEKPYGNWIDALTVGAMDGLKVSACVVAMLIAMVATVSLCNNVIGAPAKAHNRALLARAQQVRPELTADAGDAPAVQAAANQAGINGSAWHPPTFQGTLGYLFRPLAWGLGVTRRDVPRVAELLGQRTVLNEFLAYLTMSQELAKDPQALTERSRILTTYALCSFANLGSVAIIIGGMAAMVPLRRRELAELGIPALIGGTLAAHMTACVVGMLI